MDKPKQKYKGFVLYRFHQSGEKYYLHCNKEFALQVNGKPAIICTTRAWADFKASALSSGDFGIPAWQVEQIEFEIDEVYPK